MKFVLDENLPPRMARILNELCADNEHEVVHLATDLGLRGVADTEWFSQLDKDHEWAIITHDFGIKRNPHELMAWQAQGHVVFFLAKGWQHVGFMDQVWPLVRWWPVLLDTAISADRPSSFIVPFKSVPSRLEPIGLERRTRRPAGKRRRR